MTNKTKIALSAALGGTAPNLAVLSARLLGDVAPEYPSLPRAAAYGLGLLIMAGMGAGVATLWGETSFRKAFYLGFGLPAMLQLNIANLDSIRKAREAFEKPPSAVSQPAPGQSRLDAPVIEARPLSLVGRILMGHAAFAQPPAAPATNGSRAQGNQPTTSTRQLLVDATSPAVGMIEYLDKTGARIETRRLVSGTQAIPREATALELRVGDSRAGPYGLPQESFGDAGLKVKITEQPAAGFLKALGAWSTDSWKLDASVVAYPRRVFPHALAGDARAREAFQSVSQRLTELGVQMQALQLVSQVPNHSEIRFYSASDRDLAEQVAAAAAAAGVTFTVVDHTHSLGASRVRPRTVEAWLATGAGQGQPPLAPGAPHH